MSAAGLIRNLRQHPGLTVGLLLLALLTLLVFFGPLLSPHDADTIDFDGTWGLAPSSIGGHWFGTDSLGRDVFVRTLEGGRISLSVALAATAVALVIGVLWGAIAGVVGGKVDAWMMRTVDVLYALPFLFLVILLMVLLGRSLVLVFVAIGAIYWLDMARIVRGQAMALREREFVAAAQVAGEGRARILCVHILPNLLGVVLVSATLIIPQVILAESFLSFLGLGIQEPATSWGALINEGARDMRSTPWALICPATAMALTLLAFNLIGDGLRDLWGSRA